MLHSGRQKPSELLLNIVSSVEMDQIKMAG